MVFIKVLLYNLCCHGDSIQYSVQTSREKDFKLYLLIILLSSQSDVKVNVRVN